MMLRFALMISCLTASVGRAADVIPPAEVRFATANVTETPNFQRHVSPLLGRLGCNGRACHGSFQGQGGFRLSLFGYDFAADHAAIGKRMNRQQAGESLLLQKPTLVPRIIIARPPKLGFHQLLGGLPIFPSRLRAGSRFSSTGDGRCRSSETVWQTCG